MTSSSNRPATNTVTTDASETTAPALELSFTKITGGALAAVTTAVAASFLGVNGTLTGAAFGSVVSSVAAALYAASLKTAHTRIRTTRTVVTGQGHTGAEQQDPAALPAELTGRSAALPGETMVMPTPEGHPSAGSVPPYPGHLSPPPRRERRIPWKSVAIMAGLVFVTAMAAIFATEVLIGHPISNSQESGTSVSRLVQPEVAPATRKSKSSSSTETSSSDSTSSSDTTSTDSPSPTDSASLAPGETTSGETGTPQPTDSTQGGQTTDQGGQTQSQPASSPTDSAAVGGAANGAAAPTATP
jgi:hypothetical protein